MTLGCRLGWGSLIVWRKIGANGLKSVGQVFKIGHLHSALPKDKRGDMNEGNIPLSKPEQTLGSIVYHRGRILRRSNANPPAAAFEYRRLAFCLAQLVTELGKAGGYSPMIGSASVWLMNKRNRTILAVNSSRSSMRSVPRISAAFLPPSSAILWQYSCIFLSPPMRSRKSSAVQG